jgi:hypothetical protein
MGQIAISRGCSKIFQDKTRFAAKAILKELSRQGIDGATFFSRRGEDEPLPWDMIQSHSAPREKLLRQWQIYQKRAFL